MALMLDRMTYREVDDYNKKGRGIVIVPSGATEQHGSAGPLGCDTFAAEVVAVRLADRLGAVVAPSLAYGFSANHLHYPGTVTLRPSTFISLVKEVCIGLAHSGFRTVIVLTGNRANDSSVECACWEAKLELKDTRVLWLAYQSVMKGRLTEAVGHNVRSEDAKYGSSGHGGYVEMSLAALYDPNSVRPKLYEKPDTSRADFKRSLSVGGPMYTEEYTDDGIFGDPHGTSPEMGEKIASFCADEIAKQINVYLEQFAQNGQPVKA